MNIKNERGITGVDLTVSLLIITIFIVLVSILISNINQLSNEIDRTTQATSYAIDSIEEIKRNGYIDTYDDKGISTEEIIFDDYISENNAYTGFSKTILIKDYSIEKSDKMSNVIKKLTVEITYKVKGRDRTISLSTYVVND